MVYIVPNWNVSWTPVSFDSVESMYSYADKKNLCVSLVEKSNRFFHKKYGLKKQDIVFVGF